MARRQRTAHRVPTELRAEAGQLLKLTHIRLLVEDVEKVAAFYRDVMAFEVRVDAGVYIELIAGDALLGIYQRHLMADRVGTTDRPPTTNAQDGVCLTFEVDDVDRTVEELSNRGAEIATAPHDEEEWVLRVAHVRDPEGNLLEINSPLSR